MLDGFIKKFVLCEKCENPETVIKVGIKSIFMFYKILNTVVFSQKMYIICGWLLTLFNSLFSVPFLWF